MLPLGVEVGLKVPQVDAGVQLQLTPPPAESFLTVAATLAVPPAPRTPGGVVESATDTDCGVGLGAGELPPPQPKIVPTMPMARRDKILFMTPLHVVNLSFIRVLALA